MHLIASAASAPSFDEVLTVTLGADAPSSADLAKGVIAHAAGKADALPFRVGGRTGPTSITLTDGSRAFAIHPATTLSCLIGPDFGAPCE